MRKIVGINFDRKHIGDLPREAHRLPGVECAGVCDADLGRMAAAVANLTIPPDRVFTDVAACLSAGEPELMILRPATARHAEVVEEVAALGPGAAILMEKPFAASLAEADRMIAAAALHGCCLAINWPLAWSPSHLTAKPIVDDGAIGRLHEVHHYGGNRGPLFHRADKVEVSREEVERKKAEAWWYKAASGGGSLLDYLGYGATLGTWFLDGEAPLEVTSVAWGAPGLEVDEHSMTVLRYERGLSKMETRWGTFTDPWTIQPQPRCGFVLVGAEGTISSWNYDDHVTVQTRAEPRPTPVPNDPQAAPRRGPVEYLLHCIEAGGPVTGPLDPGVSRMGQRIVDTAVASARAGRLLPLIA